MTFLAPVFLVAAGLIAGAVVAIHFIVTREPRTVILPTARFAPVRPVRARARTLRPQDLLLLLLRVLIVLAVGAALAQPTLRPSTRPLARILVVDRSRAVADPREVADSARALFHAGDAVVLFDTAATVVRDHVLDTLATLAAIPHHGRLSAALVAALRTASAMRETADSIELAIVSPLVIEQVDAATDSVRALWPGGVRLVSVAMRRDSSARPIVAVEGAADDPLRLSLVPPPSSAPVTVRIVRGGLSSADSAWAGQGRTVVHWPARIATLGTDESLPLSAPWTARAARDTVGAVSAGNAVVVAPFERTVHAPDRASTEGTRVVARWVDGDAAAIEQAHGRGCIRTVTVDVPSRGDLVLQPRFAAFAAALTAPCGDRAAMTPLDDARRAALAGARAESDAAGDALPPPEQVPLPLVPWLFGAALLFLLGALLMQRWIAEGTEARGVDVT